MPVMYIPGHSKAFNTPFCDFPEQNDTLSYTKGWFLEFFFLCLQHLVHFILSNQNKMFNFIYENKLNMLKTFKLQTVHMVSSMGAGTGKVQ